MGAMNTQHRLAAVRHPVEFKMDESTQQLLTALEQRVRLQLKPIEARQEEMLDELKSWRTEMQTLKTEAALSQHDMARLKHDLDRGLSAIRKEVADSMEELEEKIKDRNKLLTPLFAALASVTAIILVLFVRWIMSS